MNRGFLLTQKLKELRSEIEELEMRIQDLERENSELREKLDSE